MNFRYMYFTSLLPQANNKKNEAEKITFQLAILFITRVNIARNG